LKIKKLSGKAAMVLAISLGVGAVLAHAAPGIDAGKRLVIDEAEYICVFRSLDSDDLRPFPESITPVYLQVIQDVACGVLYKTDGDQVEDEEAGCPADSDGFNLDAADGAPFVEYLGRNCDRNEEALRRKMASVVLSLDDAIERYKTNQLATAASYACDYASKVAELNGVGKLNQNPSGPPPAAGEGAPVTDAEDLYADAQDIVLALGFECD